LFGAGATLTYTPSLAILGHYFKRHIGIANGIVTAGSSLFTIGMPLVLEYLLTNIGVRSLVFGGGRDR
jgi:MCP family monocarboxylic acid transporter-like MFS transporter 10